ncbi:hypothetical protein OPV22_022650 [Ensete ventricosum]|uniref:Uncharacterized protein n=1 Tax=Ensete ventricosum TaxID=4639 RepID=A0AAV8QNY4_ENSVE|nr:hypothetical protein OPV22_022650 [Ensete ventricosum]
MIERSEEGPQLVASFIIIEESNCRWRAFLISSSVLTRQAMMSTSSLAKWHHNHFHDDKTTVFSPTKGSTWVSSDYLASEGDGILGLGRPSLSEEEAGEARSLSSAPVPPRATSPTPTGGAAAVGARGQ